ncbi:uncharacterized protein LOC133653277 isoform X1 [Entelurus aequoreus]|uniref:uncharacterized protein LOC133653277 isoform X1 n=1 Tax=Entelurus aequoreus TaxID=161455 RepID=UPI002B1E8C0C|nr:uncharacterized protein LOC133653277 isoform X1 [Entelurus aequoreus]XP_061908365.1 uncharacterized protein LOC133653277 isoform X1 [Entelurus aequoreus]
MDNAETSGDIGSGDVASTERDRGHDAASLHSTTTAGSSLSSTSKAAIKARAKLEAARARASYGRREAELKAKEARIAAELSTLQDEKEVAAALAETQFLEEAAELESREGSRMSHFGLASNSNQRTHDYVEQHTKRQSSYGEPPVLETYTPQAPQLSAAAQLPKELTITAPTQQTGRPTSAATQQHTRSVPAVHRQFPDTVPPRQFSPVQSYYPPLRTPLQSNPKDMTAMSDIARYFVRRELVSSGLTQFNDHPENYWAWKSSYINATGELNLNASEELNLLTKWLGRESSEHVKRIRSVHVANPAVGLQLVWERLEECYGSPEVIERSLFKRLEDFPKLSNKEPTKLRELGDLLSELNAAKSEDYLQGLSYLDTARGVNPIVEKLPHGLQEKWLAKGSQYKEQYNVSFPPFAYFTDFICSEARRRNDPSFSLTLTPLKTSNHLPKHEQFERGARYAKRQVSTHKTDVEGNNSTSQMFSSSYKLDDVGRQCPIHQKPHPLNKCRGFRSKPLEERRAFLKDNGVCFKCCSSTTHLARNCKTALKCNECESDDHVAALHPGPPPWDKENKDPPSQYGGESEEKAPGPAVTSKCTEVCGKGQSLRSCSKICLVKVYPKTHPDRATNVYILLDDQSNRSLARSEFFDLFQIKGSDSPYTLRTCAGVSETSGRRATGFIAESLDGKTSVVLPTLIECNHMPDDRSEIPTPEVARHHNHLRSIAHMIPRLDPEAQILILLGRDVLQVHKVREQRNGPQSAPFAQRLDLGWVVVGDVCLGSAHKAAAVTSYRTSVLENGRPSLLTPCPNQLQVKERFSSKVHNATSSSSLKFNIPVLDDSNLGNTIFQSTKDDDQVGLSIEDRMFLDFMDREMTMDDTNSWVAPLPFRSPRQRLPNNRQQVLSRLTTLRRTFERKPKMKDDFFAFMQKIFDRNHAELAPPLEEGGECWYLPIFGVYHPQKPDKIRVVFDSSAQDHGISLNDVLLTGPDLNNSLLGVLLRFRRETVAVIADIEQMFHSFVVRKDNRDFLRFLWFKENDPGQEIVEYRMKVHIFGNSPSPAVAIYGLHRAAEHGAEEHGLDAKHFVERDFYVDDGLTSLPSATEAIDLLTRTQEMLAASNLRLHKIASNCSNVLKAFSQEDHAGGLQNLDFDDNSTLVQRSLGLSWELKHDIFTYKTIATEKPYTRRGALAVVNSLFDPLGLVAPVVIQGKFLLRELTCNEALDWDTPLPKTKEAEWKMWKDSLQDLQDIRIPRAYSTTTLSTAQKRELHFFCDASVKAIAAVGYLKVIDSDGGCHVGFVLGKAKLAPPSAHTIPRLELGAAVLAVEMAELVQRELDICIDTMHFYTDSRVVLGYIYNQTRRFYVYVCNRVQRIRRSTKPDQWHYVHTAQNPADHASRSVPATELTNTTWFTGPTFLYLPDEVPSSEMEHHKLVDPDTDSEVRSHATALSIPHSKLGSHRFGRFSTWKSLVRAITSITNMLERKRAPVTTGDITKPVTAQLSKAETIIISCVQKETYRTELDCLAAGKNIPKDSPLRKLDPYMDEKGLLRIGGRLKHATLDIGEQFPIIIPAHNQIGKLLVRHYHQKVKHQGRVFTEGSIRTAGYWIVGAKRCINSILRKCVVCNKLRGRTAEQKMADLPPDRLCTEPPFTYVGLDVFGPWSVTTRRTRGGQAESKRWAVLFTCMSTRAVHIELIESMETSSFINALRRLFALRGPAKQIRSDCGTNFIGACKELHMVLTDPKEPNVRKYLGEEGCTWIFNPPHSSHMGGAWERMIGVSRRILDSMLQESSRSHLTHEVLSTLMAEVTAIINARPLTPISSDPESPFLLTPASLLTQKLCTLPAPPGTFDNKDLYRQQWRKVQHLANTFWHRWRREYLPTLQNRNKWQDVKPNLKEGDLVLLKDNQAKRNEWPLALVTKTFPDQDGKVRKIELKVTRSGSAKTFLRPVSETVLLLAANDTD